jgi:hypothetical protein
MASMAQDEQTKPEVREGSLGADMNWRFADGTLTISGKGEMPSYAVETQTSMSLNVNIGGGSPASMNSNVSVKNRDAKRPWHSFRKSVTRIDIEEGVKNIGARCFATFKELESVNIPISLRGIGEEAFEGCSKLTSIEIPDGVIYIGSSAFASCEKIEKITLPRFISRIEDAIFFSCSNLTSITIPGKVKHIGSSTIFGSSIIGGCKNLTTVELRSATPPQTGRSAFTRVPLEKMKLIVPAGTKAAYEAKKPWQKFGTIEEGDPAVEEEIPEELKNDPQIAIPLESVNLNLKKEVSPGVFRHVENDTLIVSGKGDIPGMPEWIGKISTVTTVIIEDGITTIGHHAFNASKATSITIGRDVTSLKMYAFSNCSKLASMEVKSTTPPKMGAFVFLLTPVKKAKLIVPAGTKAIYKKSKGWKDFGTIEENEE